MKKLAIRVPGKLTAKPGRLLVIRPDTQAAKLVFVVTDCKGSKNEPSTFPNDGKDVQVYSLALDADLLPYVGKSVLFLSQTPGTYHVLVYTAAGDTPSLPALCQVTVEGPPPAPVPPTPPPVPPGPNDPLLPSVRAAYQAEQDPGKAQQVAILAEVYKQAGGMIESRSDLKTWGQVWDWIAGATRSAGAWGKLVGVQKVLQGELRKLGDDPAAALDSSGRTRAKELFTRLSAVLGAV